jgi:hypothetical protein
MSVDANMLSASVRIRAATIIEGLQLFEKGTLSPRNSDDLITSLSVNIERMNEEFNIFIKEVYSNG